MPLLFSRPFVSPHAGLLGSEAYAKHLKDTNADVIAMFNGDMLGYVLASSDCHVSQADPFAWTRSYTLPNKPITLGMKDRYISDWLLQVSNDLTSLYV